MRPSSWFPSADPAPVRAAGPLRHGRQAGFSLIEVLAAVVLTLALVVAVMPFAANVVTRWMTGQRQIEQADLWMRSMVRLMDDAGRALSLSVAGGGDEPEIFFRGGEREMVFVREPLSAASGWSLEQVSYAVERSDDGQALVRRSRPFDAQGLGLPGTAYEASTTIVSGPYRFRFIYMSPTGSLDPEWRDRQAMPRLAQVAVEATGARAVPPSPIVLPFLAASPAGEHKKDEKRPQEGGEGNRPGGGGGGQRPPPGG